MPIALHANTVTEALDRADQRHWTRQPPRSDRARLRHLLRREPGGLPALAARLGTTPEDLAATAAGNQAAEPSLHTAAEREILRIWQPRIRTAAHDTIVRGHGQMMLSFRARFGFTAATGSSDDPRLRFLTLALHPPYPERLFTARHQETPETELHHILGQGLAASYFQYNNTAVAEEVTLRDIDFLEFYY